MKHRIAENIYEIRSTSEALPPRWRVVVGTLLFSLIAFGAFTLPDHPDALGLSPFLRLPLEWPLGALVLLMTSGRLRRVLGLMAAVVVFVILFLKIADIGTQAAFQRPFNPYLDIKMIGDGWNLMSGTFGSLVAVLVASMAVAGLLLLMGLFLRSMQWMAHARGLSRALLLLAFGALAIIGSLLLALGRPGVELHMAGYLSGRLSLVVRSIDDMRLFEAELKQGTGPRSGERLFQAVAGKDVVLIFVESYGRSAVDDPRYAGVTRPRLQSVQAMLDAAGLQSASAWVRSPTVGGLSWLAHGTLLSGLWVDSQARYDRLIRSDQPSLNRLFAQAGWKTAAIMPAITMDWPDASYYGYSQILPAAGLGYRGKPFNWITMPDQYTLAAFERLVRGPERESGKPFMAEIALISSHAPWTPVARMIDWDAVGDGSVFNEQATSGDPPSVVWSDPDRVRRQYIATIDYSLETLGSYMARFGKDTVFIVLGDHQPAAIVTGPNASRAVPLHVVSGDTDLIARFRAEGFSAGMLPAANAREWPMDAMRQVLIDRFSER
ncbi:sulfatase-like hydrolase/transferase [Rhizobium sp. AG855]|uniref:sulfatase-like hydrolase/transferase n=1 Tax=Rhizobium sp. AG855 TaxID=2183898 RepID=UPI000E7626AB|nr:sulfatase-like hydrolase/transferase [Rhizobium sp. AG855]RKE79178.1 phosphoglycerol transferase MdoB-like AlkP superfamily enzyme [Rhizobium sp. AG855]